MPQLKKIKVDAETLAEIREISIGAQRLARDATNQPSCMAAGLGHALAAVIADTGEPKDGAAYDVSEELREQFLEDTLKAARENFFTIRQEVLKRRGAKEGGS